MNSISRIPISRCIAAFLILFLAPACRQAEAGVADTAPVDEAAERPLSVDSREDVRSFLDHAARYLDRYQQESGRFEYLINPEGTSDDRGVYNVVRHAGVLYALGTYALHTGDTAIERVIEKSSRYLWDTNVRPLANTGHLAVWSLAGENFYADSFEKAKLGATGLGLVGLLLAEQILGKPFPLEQLRQLGGFLSYMQVEDGGFYSTYHEKAGRVDLKKYQYYPGQAALGFCSLYERDPQEKWLQGAVRAISRSADSMAEMEKKPVDHWDLLAIARIFGILQANNMPLQPYDNLLVYARRLAERLLKEWEDSEVPGSFTADFSTTPNATRLEGLTAIIPYLDAGDPLIPRLAESIRQSCQFLLDAQIREGPYAGGIPMAAQKKDTLSRLESRFAIEQFNNKAAEIRIDYIQHAMSALMGFDRLVQLGLLKQH